MVARRRPGRSAGSMSVLHIIAAILVVLLLAYLFVALLKPEFFS
jgi:K+-transporting ATPase KdpF subunit